MGIQENLSSGENDIRLLEALASLNQISGTINRIGSEDVISSEDSLRLIVESAIRVVPGSSAVIYTFDEAQDVFSNSSRVSAEPGGGKIFGSNDVSDDLPRQNGFGTRAITRRRSVLSYEETDIQIHAHYAGLGVKAVGCFPLIVVEQVVGVLYVYLQEDRQFTRLELLMLDNFVNQAAMAIYHT
jgi:GAF domain-containing protein